MEEDGSCENQEIKGGGERQYSSLGHYLLYTLTSSSYQSFTFQLPSTTCLELSNMSNSPGSPTELSGFDSKQPFPPLSADDLATTSEDSRQHDYSEVYDQEITSPDYGDVEVEDDADFQSHYSLENQSFSDASSDSDDQAPDDGLSLHNPFRQSCSSLHSPNAFAPPFYNRPPTPLPPSPSLTSLLRPPFSTTTSRPTTPDSSDVETPNDTEAAVAKSARRATTVPRASPKVPTYEYYGFVLYLASSLAFCKCWLIFGVFLADCSFPSDIHSLVLPSFTFSTPTRYLLLSQSLVVARFSIMAGHVDYIHIRCARVV